MSKKGSNPPPPRPSTGGRTINEGINVNPPPPPFKPPPPPAPPKKRS
jgi:hypothetical protein